jgi:hypothetical protein
VTTRQKLPYWVQREAGYSGQVFLYGVMLGFTKNQWPVQAFAVDKDGGCSQGAYWAAQSPDDRVLVGPIEIPDDVPVRVAQRIPERIELV